MADGIHACRVSPASAIFIQTFAITLPIWISGYDQRTVTLFLMMNSRQGLICHFNVDVRMGWANYMFGGTKLQRHHRRADVEGSEDFRRRLVVPPPRDFAVERFGTDANLVRHRFPASLPGNMSPIGDPGVQFRRDGFEGEDFRPQPRSANFRGKMRGPRLGEGAIPEKQLLHS